MPNGSTNCTMPPILNFKCSRDLITLKVHHSTMATNSHNTATEYMHRTRPS